MTLLDRILFWRPGPTTIRIDRNDGFVDISLAIVKQGTTDHGGRWFRAQALQRGRALGFDVELSRDWSPWELEEQNITLWRGLVTYKSVGAESDRFLETVAREYKVRTPSRMARAITFAAIALEGNPGDRSDSDAKIKLFFESDLGDEYAEFYTNIYPKSGVLEFHEKDPGYRSALVQALAGRQA
ncbi:MAG TPA: hypothetical protein VJZ76_02075 [Thermoanaerobaculia bacterium]|nr:hypothetical protein [Thermoanaerobaculia bacterium]